MGGSLGVSAGAIIGALVALGSFAVMSGFSIVVAGPIAAWLSGVAAGGIAGGLVGVLINMGISENHAAHLKKELQDGAILIIVTPHSEEDRMVLETEWNKYDGIVLST